MVLPILEYFSSVLGSAAEYHLQQLERNVYSVAMLCPDHSFLSLCDRRHFAGQCMLYVRKVNSNSNYCLFSELPSASERVRHTRAAASAQPLEFEVSKCRTSQFARCFLTSRVCKWNYLANSVFDTGFECEVKRWLLPLVVFFSVFRGAGACGFAKEIYKQFCFSHARLCCWF